MSVAPDDPGSGKRARDEGDLEDNKRLRLSGINFQGGKLLGENLQSFGDRLRRRIPGKKTGADADAKTSGPLSSNRNAKEHIGRNASVQSGEVQSGSKKRDILDGCIVCVSRQLKVPNLYLAPHHEFRLTNSQHRLVPLN